MIGEKLKKILKLKKVSAKEFGGIIGKTEGMIYKYYNASTFDSNQILEFSRILNIPITYWFGDISNGNQTIMTNAKGSAASIYGDAIVGEMANKDKEIEHMKSLLEEKDKLLEEKERLINVLMNK
ncbi:hypothetical protein EZS27_000341 [termite gut metagenome]|uniref:HTH cro/C1-type domain-containing protein n=1 Tax=termite gut metagenome TaxID=433724 RepID=A0A5J4T3W5_9ZZZZ